MSVAVNNTETSLAELGALGFRVKRHTPYHLQIEHDDGWRADVWPTVRKVMVPGDHKARKYKNLYKLISEKHDLYAYGN